MLINGNVGFAMVTIRQVMIAKFYTDKAKMSTILIAEYPHIL